MHFTNKTDLMAKTFYEFEVIYCFTEIFIFSIAKVTF
jgi:hypothetical protein